MTNSFFPLRAVGDVWRTVCLYILDILSIDVYVD